ncbi:glycosyltransferase family 2 protein [Bizionia sp.]|uniref:glycosyltransferase family 2 protein n=1 Tax=Bizionia sp. TaxID=1954480 RepID=UPI003A958269
MKDVRLSVSVIVPNYNHASYLSERLNSIFNQTYENFEVIILDDASTDNSLEILNPYRNHPKVSHFIINKENTGSPFKQWQKGLSLAKGSIIWIAESDDFCDLNFLEAHIKNFADPRIMVSVSKTVAVDEYGSFIKEAIHHLFADNKMSKRLEAKYVLKIPILNVSSICFRKEVISNSSVFFNYNIIGDRVFYQENFLNSLIMKTSETQSYFRRHERSVSNFENKSIRYKKEFFIENLVFISREFKLNHVDKELFNKYLSKYFNKVRNRTKKKSKLTFHYCFILFKYTIALK